MLMSGRYLIHVSTKFRSHRPEYSKLVSLTDYFFFGVSVGLVDYFLVVLTYFP